MAKLWLAKDADGVVTDDGLAGSVAVPPLAVGAEALVSWAFDAPTLAAVPRGVRPVVVVDSAKAVEELNEANKFAAADPLFTLEPPVWVQVASPNGGDSWTRGQPVAISWTHRACTAVEIRLRRRTSTGWATRAIASGVPAADGTYPWMVPTNLFRSSKYKVQVLCADDAAALDLSNRYFTVQ